MKRSRRRASLLGALAAVALAALLTGAAVRSQVYADGGMEAYESEFYFTRLAYPSAMGRRRGGWGAWTTDFPEAEVHLLQGLSRLTRLDTAREGRIVTLDDDELMKYPWLYAVEVGNWVLDERQAAVLREYLLRGGFLMVDDFWGEYEWNVFFDSMVRVFPDRPIIEVPESDELLHVLYDLDERIQIPGAYSAYSGITWEKGGVTPHWRGIYDDDGRLMVAINFNMDMGDAWEHADDPNYPEPMTTLAYRFAVNYTIYAMTH
jgi:hypothetical protein